MSPKNANFGDMDATVKDYFTIANGTWNYYMNEVWNFITDLGGSATIMPPEIERINNPRGRAIGVFKGKNSIFSFMKNHLFFKLFLFDPEAEPRGILFE